MKHASVSAYQPLFSVIAAGALFLLFSVVPFSASALEVASQTQQILPPGPNTCAPIQISNFTPYIYDNALNSFEFIVSDASYVAVVGSVGNTSIPLRFMTRLTSPSGGVRIHVDIDSVSLTRKVPVTITLLSAATGKPVCASVVATSFGSGDTVATNPTPVTSAPVPPTSSVSREPTAPIPTTEPTVGGVGSATTVSPTTPAAGVVQNPLKSICTSDASAFRLWLILLIIYTLIVGGLLWLEFPLSWSWAQTPERVATIILAFLVLLLGFWYLSASCRAALWMPLVAFLVAVLGLLAAFWNHPKVTQLLLAQEKTTVIITPPPTAKK